MKTSQPTQNDYDQNYLDWKGWGDKSKPFGHIAPHTKACYDAEIRKAKIKGKTLKVLEIGFGNGGFLSYAKKRGWDVTGSEISTQLLEAAKQNGYSAIAADKVQGLPSQSFDLIVAFDVLEHIRPEDSIGFIGTLRDKLKEGGVFMARFPNGDSPMGLPYQNGDMTHTQAIGTNKVRDWANRLGMEIVRLGGETVPVFCSYLPLSIYALLSNPLRWIAGKFLKFVYFPNKRFVLNSPNLFIALRR